MDTKKINLFVFDTKENFEKSKKNLGSQGSAFKRIICVEDEHEFKREFGMLDHDELVFMVVHVFYTDRIQGIKRFVASRLEKDMPKLGFMYISEGDTKDINKQMIEEELEPKKVYKYHQVQSSLEEDKFRVYNKSEISQQTQLPLSSREFSDDLLEANCEYGIITALEEDEMEKLLKFIKREGTLANTKCLIEYGHFISNPTKKIVYASQPSTGMVDASIIATEILIKFKPKFLIMAGVLGGKPGDVQIGDIVVANKVMTIDKGKITELGFKHELETSSTDSSYITLFRRQKNKIIDFIAEADSTRNSKVNIHFGTITCVRQVIDIEGFFEEKISIVDRKAIALEMESYGIARACELVNDGKTIPIIVKSAMDNTVDKTDDAKPYAAWTSAMFVRYILENDII